MKQSYFDDPTSLIYDFAKDVNINNLWNNDWVAISRDYQLSSSFIEKYHDKLDWFYLTMHQILPLELIEKFSDRLDWYCVSTYQTLPEHFIEKYQNKVYWVDILTHQNLSDSFIEKHQDKLDWFYISTYQNLPETFIEKHQNKVIWYCISNYQDITKFSENFVEKFKDKLSTKELALRQKHYISVQEYAEKHNLKIKDGYLYAYRNHDKMGNGAYKLNSFYKKGVYYKDWHCDTNPYNYNSFGLGVWAKGNTPVRVKVEDWGTAVYRDYSGKARVWGFEIV